jgi:hypothetical protein
MRHGRADDAMTRGLLNLLTSLSLLSCVAVAALWVRSYFVSDIIECEEPGPAPFVMHAAWPVRGRICIVEDIRGTRAEELDADVSPVPPSPPVVVDAPVAARRNVPHRRRRYTPESGRLLRAGRRRARNAMDAADLAARRANAHDSLRTAHHLIRAAPSDDRVIPRVRPRGTDSMALSRRTSSANPRY